MDTITYRLEYTYLDGPYEGEQGTKTLNLSKFRPSPTVGLVMRLTETLFGNAGRVRITAVSKA